MASNGSPTEKMSQFVDVICESFYPKIQIICARHYIFCVCLLEEVDDRGQHICHHGHYVNVHQHL